MWKVSGIKIENNLNFTGHVESLFKKESQKTHALSALASSMDFEQIKFTILWILLQFVTFPIVQLRGCVTAEKWKLSIADLIKGLYEYCQ